MIDRLVARTPGHNPVVRFWLTAARVAVEASEAEKAMALARLMKWPADTRPDTNVMVLVDKVLANQPGVSEYGILLDPPDLLDRMDRMGVADLKIRIYEDVLCRYPAERKANMDGYQTALKKSGQSEAFGREWMHGVESVEVGGG